MRKAFTLVLLVVACTAGAVLLWLGRPPPEGAGGLGGDALPGAGDGAAPGIDPLAPAATTGGDADRPAGTGGMPMVATPLGPGLEPHRVRHADPRAIAIVDDASGNLLPGAEVYVAPDPDGRDPQWRMQRAGVADAAGRFDARGYQHRREAYRRQYGSAPYLVAIVPGRGTSAWLEVPPDGTTGAELRVRAGGEVTGTVRDPESGRAIPLAGLQAEVESQGGFGAIGAVARADAEGRYRVAGLPPRRILRVRVVADAHAEPIADVDRLLEPPLQALEAGRAARFFGPGERTVLDVEAFGHPGVVAVFTLSVPEGAAMPERVTVTHGYAFSQPNTTRRRGGAISSTGGNERSSIRYAGDRIEVSRERDAAYPIDPQRPEITLFLPAGMNHVGIYTEILTSAPWSSDIAGYGPPLRVARALTPKRAVMVQLVDAAGAPVERAGVRVLLTQYRVSGTDSETGTSLGDVHTAASGRAEITRLLRPVGPDAGGAGDRIGFALEGAGLYLAEHWGSGDAALMLTGAQLAALLQPAAPGAPAVVRVPALPARPLSFRVVDAAGRPLSGVEVVARPGSRFRVGAVRTNSDGLVTFDYVGVPQQPQSEGRADAGTEPERRINAFGTALDPLHWEDPVFVVSHATLSGKLDLDAVQQRATVNPAELQEYRADIEAEAEELRRRAGADPQALANAEQEIARGRLEIEALADPYARLTATGSRLLELECVDGEGRPWAGASVSASSDSAYDTPDTDVAHRPGADGVVRARIPIDAKVLYVTAEDPEGQALFPAARALDPAVQRYRIVLHRQRRMELVVRWPAGASPAMLMPTTTFHIRDAATGSPIGSTQASGGSGPAAGLIRLPARRIALEAQSMDGVYRGSAEVDVPAGGQVVLDMQRVAQVVEVRVRVVDRAGAPATGLIRAYATSADGTPFAWSGELDPEGSFLFPLTAGGYQMMSVQVGADLATQSGFAVPPGTPLTLHLGK